jgi:hypothetical protein
MIGIDPDCLIVTCDCLLMLTEVVAAIPHQGKRPRVLRFHVNCLPQAFHCSGVISSHRLFLCLSDQVFRVEVKCLHLRFTFPVVTRHIISCPVPK